MTSNSTRRRFLAHLGALLAIPVTGVRADAAISPVAQAERDRQAFMALYDHFAPRVYSFLLRSGSSDFAASRLTAVVMLKLWQRPQGFEASRSSLAAFLVQQARNARLDHIRHWRGQPGENPFGRRGAPVEVISGLAWDERLRPRPLLARFPAEQRAMMRLLCVNDLLPGEIEWHTGLPMGTVYARISLALMRLRRARILPRIVNSLRTTSI
jgi:RNA polymerase sigma-70 factor, ECF subfamily